MERLRKILKDEDGNVIVLTALLLTVIMAMSALAIDIGYVAAARAQMQAAVDASALAGASGLMYDHGEATNRAITVAAANDCMNDAVVVTTGDVSFPAADQVRVQASRTLNLFFAPVIGINTATVNVFAVAEFGVLNGVGNLKPFAIPYDEYNPFPLGQPVVLKAGAIGADATSPSFFYPVDFPPINRGTPITGASEYYDNILNGADDLIYIGDELQIEPGNMVGPTVQGINDLIAMDPTAYWDSTGGPDGAGGVVSDFPGYSSPRILKIPFYDFNIVPDSGRNSVIVIRLGAFFLEGMQGRDVIGRFIEITAPGSMGPGPSSLYGVHLIQ